jgi:hypothetical protein
MIPGHTRTLRLKNTQRTHPGVVDVPPHPAITSSANGPDQLLGRILDLDAELCRNLVKADGKQEAVEHRLAEMAVHFPDALVTGKLRDFLAGAVR